jgi:H+/Cl- antiporter ClcA
VIGATSAPRSATGSGCRARIGSDQVGGGLVGATNTPLTCTVVGVGFFRAGPIVLVVVACIASHVVAAERGIYGSQRVDTSKTTGGGHEPGW